MKIITRSGVHDSLFEIEAICTDAEVTLTLKAGEEILAKHLEVIHRLMKMSYDAGLNKEGITMFDSPLNQ